MREPVRREVNAGGFVSRGFRRARRSPLVDRIRDGPFAGGLVVVLSRIPAGTGQREFGSAGRGFARSRSAPLERPCPRCPAAVRTEDSGAPRLGSASPRAGRTFRAEEAFRDCVQCRRRFRSPARCGHDQRWGRWLPAAPIRPVLKHGPRSATRARVLGWQSPGRSESKDASGASRWEPRPPGPAHHRPIPSTPWRDSSESVPVATRKMVNYARAGRSQGKPWWRPAAILTCKSIVWFGYRGERLIEPSSSWFPPKFPSG